MIEIIAHTHARELISLSGAYLERHENENNLPIGLAYRLAEDPYYYGPEFSLLRIVTPDLVFLLFYAPFLPANCVTNNRETIYY